MVIPTMLHRRLVEAIVLPAMISGEQRQPLSLMSGQRLNDMPILCFGCYRILIKSLYAICLNYAVRSPLLHDKPFTEFLTAHGECLKHGRLIS